MCHDCRAGRIHYRSAPVSEMLELAKPARAGKGLVVSTRMKLSAVTVPSGSFHFFDIRHHPGLIEERFSAVETGRHFQMFWPSPLESNSSSCPMGQSARNRWLQTIGVCCKAVYSRTGFPMPRYGQRCGFRDYMPSSMSTVHRHVRSTVILYVLLPLNGRPSLSAIVIR